jgi:hypothetical protein
MTDSARTSPGVAQAPASGTHSDDRPPTLVEWFNNLMKDPHERQHMRELVALAFESKGDPSVELEILARTGR